jgi:hypothetical protein
MAEPATRAIASRFPRARLEAQAPRPLMALARARRFADAVLPVYAGSRVPERLDPAWAPPRLRRRRFDLCAFFPNARGVADVVRAARQALDGARP